LGLLCSVGGVFFWEFRCEDFFFFFLLFVFDHQVQGSKGSKSRGTLTHPSTKGFVFPTVREITTASEAMKLKAQQPKRLQKTQEIKLRAGRGTTTVLFVLNAATLNYNLKAIQESLQPFQSSQPSGL